VQKNKCK